MGSSEVVAPVAAVVAISNPQFSMRPNTDDVYLYREKVFEIFCGIRLEGARSKFGRNVEVEVLVLIAALAAPYIVDGRIFQTLYVEDKFATDYLLPYQITHRDCPWWWNSVTWNDEQLRAKCNASEGILTGGIGIVPSTDQDNIRSDVYRVDENGENEYFVMAIERSGSMRIYMDLMVYKSQTMRQLLGFLTKYFSVESKRTTELIFWGMKYDGTANLKASKGGLGLDSESTSPMLDKTMGEMWEIMNKLSSDFDRIWRADDTDDEDLEQHGKWWAILRHTITFMAYE